METEDAQKTYEKSIPYDTNRDQYLKNYEQNILDKAD